LEDYGQPNHILFLYHGFTLTSNDHDCVRFDFNISKPERVETIRQQLSAFGFHSFEFTACLTFGSPQPIRRSLQFLSIKYGVYTYSRTKDITDPYLTLLAEVDARLVGYSPSPTLASVGQTLTAAEINHLRELGKQLNALVEDMTLIPVRR